MALLLNRVLIGLFVVMVVAYGLHKFVQKLRQKRALVRQQELGEKLFNLLVTAAQRNRISNILPNRIVSADLLPIAVEAQFNNAEIYSIVVFMKGINAINGRIPILHVDINLLNGDPTKRIHVLAGPFHNDLYFTEEEFGWAIPVYASSIEHYAFFRETQKEYFASLDYMPHTFIETPL